MWHKLTVMLFLLVLAQSANALHHAEINQIETSQKVSVSFIDQSNAAVFADDAEDNSFTLPRLNRHNPSLFSAEIQTTPLYLLEIEFFKVKLSAGLFKNLANPPVTICWFEQLGHSTNSSRLSGWKDGNSLYSSRTTYHS